MDQRIIFINSITINNFHFINIIYDINDLILYLAIVSSQINSGINKKFIHDHLIRVIKRKFILFDQDINLIDTDTFVINHYLRNFF
jgi:hypothetical protein